MLKLLRSKGLRLKSGDALHLLSSRRSGSFVSQSGLEEYVLVSQHEGLVERFTRKEDGSWRLDRYANDDRLHLESLDCMIDLDAVYEDVTLSTERGNA